MGITRKANEQDREAIALCIAEGFEKDFAALCKDTAKVAKAISSGIQINKFCVAEVEGEVAGVVAVSDCRGRAVITDGASYRKYFGLVKGLLAQMVLKEEFEASLDYPDTTGYLEFVAVRKQYRRRGIATTMLKECLATGAYAEYVLDVTDVNTAAQQCYAGIGFKEFSTVLEKNAKQKGFHAKIYMMYKPAERFVVDCNTIEAVHLWKNGAEQVFQKDFVTEGFVADLVEEVLSGSSTRLVIDYLFQGEGMYVKKLKKRIYTPYHNYLVLHNVEGKLACLYFDGNSQYCHMLISDFNAYCNVDVKDIKQVSLGEAVLPEYGVHYSRENIHKALRSVLQNIEAANKEMYDSKLWSTQICKGEVGYRNSLKLWGTISETE